MRARRLNALLLLLGVAAAAALASEGPPLADAVKSPASSAAAVVAAAETAVEVGDVQDTAQPDDNLDITVLWKKAVKLGKCLYMKKLVACTPDIPSPPPPPMEYPSKEYLPSEDDTKDNSSKGDTYRAPGDDSTKKDSADSKHLSKQADSKGDSKHKHSYSDSKGAKAKSDYRGKSSKSPTFKSLMESDLYGPSDGDGSSGGGNGSSGSGDSKPAKGHHNAHKKKHSHSGRKHLKDKHRGEYRKSEEEVEPISAKDTSSSEQHKKHYGSKKHHGDGADGYNKSGKGDSHDSYKETEKEYVAPTPGSYKRKKKGPAPGHPPKPSQTILRKDADKDNYDSSDDQYRSSGNEYESAGDGYEPSGDKYDADESDYEANDDTYPESSSPTADGYDKKLWDYGWANDGSEGYAAVAAAGPKHVVLQKQSRHNKHRPL